MTKPIAASVASSKPVEKPQATKPQVASTSTPEQAKQPARQGSLNFGALTKTKSTAQASSKDQADDSKAKKTVSNSLFKQHMLTP